MDVTRGDRVLWGVAEWEVVDVPNDVGRVPLRHPTVGSFAVASVDDLSPLPPDVVTLTLSYRRHEVSEEMSVEDWRVRAALGDRGSPIARAARALAEKVDGEENPDG